MAKTLYEKIYEAHVVRTQQSTTPLIYIDRHFIHEVTSPQAFAGLKQKNRSVRCPEKTFATMDHNTSTQTKNLTACAPMARIQLETLIKNCQEYGISLYDLHHPKQGIVHIIGPEQGLTLPGMTIVCGDSHTSTHGAFGALAFGIGTSEVEHVFATQTLQQHRAKTMLIKLIGERPQAISAKDIILAIIGQIGHAGGTGCVVEFSGEIVQGLSMEERMTLCNMSIEMGAKAGLIAPDATTINYLRHRHFAPKGDNWKTALQYWQTLYSDPDAQFDHTITLNLQELAPQITWGTNPAQVIAIDATIPYPNQLSGNNESLAASQALSYMGLEAGQSLQNITIDKVFIGSCTNARIEDLRAAAAIIKGKKIATHVQALVVPGSEPVKLQAEAEGLHHLFIEAGFEWRIPGCSMCLGMNDDILQPFERCASTSNRNFEGRQGRFGRTHLVSPAMAAAAAIHGHFIDIRKLSNH